MCPVAKLSGTLWNLYTRDEALIKGMLKVEEAVEMGRLAFREEASLVDDIGLKVTRSREVHQMHTLALARHSCFRSCSRAFCASSL